ncbi:MAG: arylformamidase [Planctomycetota bacterium]|jgi:arylformamidase
MKIFDISEPISPDNAVFPGDTPFSAEWVMRMEEGASCNVSTLRMSAHLGTHADSPFHYDPAGKDSASADLSVYMGPCLVVDLRGVGEPALLDPEEVRALDLNGVERILFRTQDAHEPNEFDASFTALGPEAAKILVEQGIRLVGIDTPSMDHATSKALEAHHVLNAGGVALLENLDLSRVEPGEYELIALPLRIVGGDSSPVRAILRRP